MPHKDERLTLVGFLCNPFLTKIIKESLLGGPYVRSIDLLSVSAHIYSIGAVLGRALRDKLDTLTKLLFVPSTEDHKVDRVMQLCKKDAKNNLGREPATFDDFAFYSGIEKRLRTEGIDLSPQDAFEAYSHGDRKIKKLFDEKVASEGVGEHTAIMLLQGINFGSSSPELTEKMYRKAYEDERDFWAGKWYGVTIPEEFKVASLEAGEGAVLQIAVAYTLEYYPELLDSLDLRDYINTEGSR
tara:strand:+ start:410 stop:1135 length:726 start_codon:yes stop_codon:yes gene_type:complete